MRQNGGERRENSPLLFKYYVFVTVPSVLYNLSLLKKETILSEFVASVSELSLTTLQPLLKDESFNLLGPLSPWL